VSSFGAGLAGPDELRIYVARRGRWAWWSFLALVVVAFAAALVAAPREPRALGVAAVVVVCTGMLTLVSRARTNRTWTGVVARKEVREVRVDRKDESVARYVKQYVVHARTDHGADLKVQVPEEAYRRYYFEGDGLRKLRGLPLPLKTMPRGEMRLCANCGIVHGPAVTTCPGCRCPIPDVRRF
jgi:hypothetical protein